MAECIICHYNSNRSGAKYCGHCGGRLTSLAPGENLNGRYQIIRLLGKGGMGAVCLAEDLQAFGKQCVIKEMIEYFNPSDPDEVQKAEQRFEQEARTLAQLNHPSIPDVRDYFSAAGRNYMVMDFVKGEDLGTRLQREGRPLPHDEIIDYAVQMCLVLEYLSSQIPPLVHHDIKPPNVIVDYEAKRVTLVDFGTAKIRSAPGSGGLGQGQSSVYGTIGYAPPEQYGDSPQTEPRSDVFALAATVYHLLTNDDPGDHPMSFPRLSTLPNETAQALAKALEKNVSQRITARQLRTEMEKLLQGPSVQPYVFPSGATARNAKELAAVCDRNWRDARELLHKGSFEPWLRTHLFRSDLAQQSAQLANRPDKDVALEDFLHKLDPTLISPQPVVTPVALDFRSIKLGRSSIKQFVIRNGASRGHLSGRVFAVPQPPWLNLSAQAFSGNQTTFDVVVDSTRESEGARLSTLLKIETPFAAAIEVPVHARVALTWPAMIFTLLLTVAAGGVFALSASYWSRSILRSGLTEDLGAIFVLQVLITGLLVGLAFGKALTKPDSFSGLGFLVGLALGAVVATYLFAVMFSEFYVFGLRGDTRLSFGIVVALGMIIALMVGLFLVLRRMRRSFLAILLPLLLIVILAGWVARDESIALIAAEYHVNGQSIPVHYIVMVETADRLPTPLPLVALVMGEPTASPVPTAKATKRNASTPEASRTPTLQSTRIVDSTQDSAKTTLHIGGKAGVVNTLGLPLRVRAQASISSQILLRVSEGAIVDIVGGPTASDGYTWWQVKSGDTTGWAAENWLDAVE